MNSTQNADVTIVIPVWNGEKYVGEAIDSVLSQDYPNLKIIVSDNASTDSTAEIVQSYLPTGRVTYFRQDTNIGILGNFTFLIRQVDTPYYACYSHDDYLCSPDAIRQAYSVMEQNPDVSAVYCDMVYVDAQRRKIATRKYRETGTYSADEAFRKSIISGRNLFGVALLMRTSAVSTFSYDDMFFYAGDVEHAYFLGTKGALYHIAKPLFANRYHGSNWTRETHVNLFKQLDAIASKQKVKLTALEAIRMRLNCWLVTLEKKLFFIYLGVFHKS